MKPQRNTRAARDQIDGLTHLALNQPWPGRNGARDFRVLVGVLQQAALGKCELEVVVPLEPFAAQIGLVKHEGVRDSLLDLEANGWLSFELGTPDTFGTDYERGTASRVTLLPRTSEGKVNPLALPDPTHEIFREHDGAIGSAGYLTVCQLWKSRDDRIVVTARELTETTGLSRDRISRRLLPKLVVLLHGEIDGSSRVFRAVELLRVLDNDSSYEHFLRTRRREQANNRKLTTSEGKAAVFLTLPDPRSPTGELIKIVHVGYFDRDVPMWDERQRYDEKRRIGKPLNFIRLPDPKNSAPIEDRLERFWDREARGENIPMTIDELIESLEDDWDSIDWADLEA
jgi:hypothetical protein